MSIFDQIKKINKFNQEYWLARDLYKIFSYTEYGKFIPVIERAKKACTNSLQNVNDHFAEVSDMVSIGSGAERKVNNYELSRYACYLIAMEADSSKTEVAIAKSYFAIQTRKQELNDQYIEDEKRLFLREQVSEHNKNLAKTAKQAGVINYANFVDFGYLGLYGMRNKEILQKKKLKSTDSLMDNIGSEELAANLFRATQAEAKIKRENIVGQEKVNKAHFVIGKDVRDIIKKMGGNMPENLPASDNIKEAKKRIKQSKKLIDD